jgi:hypothetical protein
MGIPMDYSRNPGSPIGIAHKEVGLPQVMPRGAWESKWTIPEMLGIPLELPTKQWESQWAILDISESGKQCDTVP